MKLPRVSWRVGVPAAVLFGLLVAVGVRFVHNRNQPAETESTQAADSGKETPPKDGGPAIGADAAATAKDKDTSPAPKDKDTSAVPKDKDTSAVPKDKGMPPAKGKDMPPPAKAKAMTIEEQREKALAQIDSAVPDKRGQLVIPVLEGVSQEAVVWAGDRRGWFDLRQGFNADTNTPLWIMKPKPKAKR